ncbi:outer membrane beta-barrel protein [Flammeovirga agarivorans]|uniref:Outer membrane protein beta-barrel domain-containing protein n=1 Tax=Flammeovirga agarivorans TaxID=2726742 RepID=A0A7X8XWJ8_9BACT|nr:outer membrane beta-barrel protein [Flammeovirga agarivorans]NLR92165.1 hypothetical protein [Flammeovirga agarivorans]
MINQGIKYIISLFLFFTINTLLQAQSNFMVSYTNTKAVGDEQVLDLNGVNIEWRTFIKKSNFSASISAGFQMSARSDFNREIDSGIISSDVKNLRIVPTTFGINYHFRKGKFFEPYIGISGASYYMTRDLYFSLLRQTQDNRQTATLEEWNFGISPEVGVITKIFDKVNVFANIEYHHVFGDKPPFNFQFMSFNVGLIF